MSPTDVKVLAVLFAVSLLALNVSASSNGGEDEGSMDGNWTVVSEDYTGFTYHVLYIDLWTANLYDNCDDDYNIGGACFPIHVRPNEDIIGNVTVTDEDGNPRPFHLGYWDDEEGYRTRPERSCGTADLGKHFAHRTIERIYIDIDEFPIPGGLCPGALTTNTGTITLQYQIVDVNETFGG